MRIRTEGSTITLHQSAIDAYRLCPDRFRVAAGIQPGGDIIPDGSPETNTDATTLGTVFHTVLETDLKVKRYKSLNGLKSFAKNELNRVLQSFADEDSIYIMSSFGQNPNTIYNKLYKLCDMWFNSQEREYWMSITEDHPECFLYEESFDVPFIRNRKGRYDTIRLAGTADLVDTYNMQVLDWKTSSRDKLPWEENRWSIQATVYTYAFAELGLLKPHDDGYHFGLRVFNHKNNEPEPQHVDVLRSENNWAFLVEMVNQMVTMVESDVEQWPMDDSHALCSPVWCPAWSTCKGTYISGEKQVWS